MDIKVRVGLRIKELRQRIRLSQEALALKSEIDRTYITDVENGKRNVSIVLLEKILNGLDVSFSEFFSSKEFKK